MPVDISSQDYFRNPAAAIYLALLWPIVRLISRLERRIAA